MREWDSLRRPRLVPLDERDGPIWTRIQTGFCSVSEYPSFPGATQGFVQCPPMNVAGSSPCPRAESMIERSPTHELSHSSRRRCRRLPLRRALRSSLDTLRLHKSGGWAGSTLCAQYPSVGRFNTGCERGQLRSDRPDPLKEGAVMIILLALLLVIVFAGLGFALHVLWIVAVVLFVLWLIGLVLGRGENAGNHRFFRW